MNNKIANSRRTKTSTSVKKVASKTKSVKTMVNGKKTGNFSRFWKKINSDMMICSGTMAQSSIKFGHMSRNKQGSANAVVASVYASIKRPVNWTSSDVDTVLKIGDELYRVTIHQSKLKPSTTFNPNCVYPTFYINLEKITIAMGDDVINGELYAEDEESENKFIENLIKLLDANDAVILRRGEINCSFLKIENVFYCFSPHDMNGMGELIEYGLGVACLIRIKGTAALKTYIVNVHQGPYSLYPLKLLSKEIIEQSLTKIMLQNELKEMEIAEKESEKKSEDKKEPEESTVGQQKIEDISKKFQDFPDPEPDFSKDYKEISPDRGILRATTFVKDPQRILYTNISCAIHLSQANAVRWTAETMSSILKLGRTIFEDSEEADLLTKEYWQERIQLPITFRKTLYTLNFEKVIFGEVVSRDPKKICEFKKGVVDFFQQCDVGLVLGPQIVILWQEAGLYFMFDPKERDGMGRKWTRLLSSALGEHKSAGACCVTWYRNISDLADIYLENIKIEYRREAFRIVKMNVVETKDTDENFEQWQTVKQDIWRIFGTKSICENSEQDLGEARYNNAICIAAIVAFFVDFRPLNEWGRETIDEIITQGVELYNQSLEFSGDKFHVMKFKLNDIKKIVNIAGQRLTFFFEECIITGPVLEDGNSKEEDLLNGLKSFFDRFMNGIVKIKDTQIAIWYRDKFYYLYFPYEKIFGKIIACFCRDIAPEKTGEAFAMRFKNLSSLHSEILNILNLDEKVKYCLSAVIVTRSKADERPPLNKYAPFDESGAVLRPFKENFHEGHEIYQLRADKQTRSNVLIALALSHINKAALWSKEDLMDILRIGDHILCNEINKLKECETKNFVMEWDNIKLEIGSHKFTYKKITEVGLFKPPIIVEKHRKIYEEGEEEEEMSTEYEEEPIPPDLHTLLLSWENEENINAIIECDFYTVAIWKQDGLYFLFDPKASNERGYPSERRITMGTDAIENRRKLMMEIEFGETEEERNIETNQQSPSIDYKTLPNDGSAYVIWFYKFNDFIDHILSKVPEMYHEERFTLYKITLMNTMSTFNEIAAGKRHFFNTHPAGHMILRGTMSQSDIMFPNAGKQEASNVIVALAFASISAFETWSSTILDVILKYGDRLYTKSLSYLKEKDITKACSLEKLSIEDLYPSFCVYKILFKFSIISKYTGGINTKTLGELRKVLGGIQAINTNIGFGIRVKANMQAVWKIGNQLYAFDSCETDPSGFRAKHGPASLCKFQGLTALLNFISKKYLCLDGPNVFEVYKIKISYEVPSGLQISGINTAELINIRERLNENESMFVKGKKNIRKLSGSFSAHKVPSLLVSLAAIVHSRVHFVELWTINVFEQIIFLAEYLTGKTKCSLNNESETMSVDLEQPITNFTLDNVLIQATVMNSYQGPIKANRENKSIDFKSALKTFYEDCSHAIIVVNEKSFALWKESGYYYLTQDKSETEGKGYVHATQAIEDMYDIMVEALTLNDSTNWYEIRACKILTLPIREACLSKKKTDKDEENAEEGDNVGDTVKSPGTVQYCDDCHYWDYITKTAKYSKLEKPKETFMFKKVSNILEILAGRTPLKKHPLYSDDCQFRSSMKAACIVAAARVCLRSPETWTSKILDSILLAAVIIYKDAAVIKGCSQLDICDFDQFFYLKIARFQVNVSPPEKFLLDKTNLTLVVAKHLKTNGILYFTASETGDEEKGGAWLVLALIFEECFSYIYFPGTKNICEESRREDNREISCLMRFKSLPKLIDQLSTLTCDVYPYAAICSISPCLQ